MNIKEKINSSLTYFDGGFGTQLQKRGLAKGEKPEMRNLTHPDDVTEIHLEYLRAGAEVICANTFGANRLKFPEKLEEIISAALKNARRAVELSGKNDCFAAFDMGPLGKMLKPLGDTDFETAVSVFAESARLAEKYGADLILIETMSDLYETKAALLAAKESCGLPVFVLNAFDENGRLMTGADVPAVVSTLEGLGADAVGMNCSVGPRQMLEMVGEYKKYTSLPLIVCPNAGMPKNENGKTVFDVGADEFSDIMAEIAALGVQGIGGCCGTTPEYIEKTVMKTINLPFAKPEKKNHTLVSSYTHAVEIGNEPVLIGERINPTGRPEFRAALSENNINCILSEGVMQQERGAQILDVNVGLPEIDEKKMMLTAVTELQAVLDLPLQIDTVKAEAMEAALRVYNGKPMINSVNAKEESLRTVLPLAKKYGGVVIALTIDEDGIPETPEGRFLLAEKIVKRAAEYGIDKKDIVVDALAVAVSSDGMSGKTALEAVRLIKERLNVKTCLGVSNISFGLPNRDDVNSVFLSMALTAGLDAAIINPYSVKMMNTYHCFLALSGADEGCGRYIDFAQKLTEETLSVRHEAQNDEERFLSPLVHAIVKGVKSKALESVKLLLLTEKPLDVINGHIVPALDEAGRRFSEKTMFLPQLLMSAEAAGSALEAVKEKLGGTGAKKEKIILATVKGDIHDIGKNIVRVLLESYGYDVIDLGRDVPSEKILSAAKESGARLVGLSALMTTTVESMRETVALLKKEAPAVSVIVGGAVLNEKYAEMIGADGYAADAPGAVRFAESFFGYRR